MKQYLHVVDRFSAHAARLRGEFDRRFADPKRTGSDRFVWDFWHVPDQYTHLRTPAEHFFSARTLRPFLAELGNWARETLGCTAITPPWLSYYVEGCEQKFHADVPHGPWAFVYSLSPRRPVFRGGETMLLRPEVLNYWPNFSDQQERELASVVERVAPRFNRLVVFDPRIPHGVSRVEGTMDPREARLVLHGWFTDPRPCLEGPLSARRVAPLLDETVAELAAGWANYGAWHGVLSLRLTVSAAGRVAGAEILADTLAPVGGGEPGASTRMRAEALRAFRALRFPRASGVTRITLPLLFR